MGIWTVNLHCASKRDTQGGEGLHLKRNWIPQAFFCIWGRLGAMEKAPWSLGLCSFCFLFLPNVLCSSQGSEWTGSVLQSVPSSCLFYGCGCAMRSSYSKIPLWPELFFVSVVFSSLSRTPFLDSLHEWMNLKCWCIYAPSPSLQTYQC